MLYRFNTKLLHLWYILLDYTPRAISRRHKAKQDAMSYYPTPVINFDATGNRWWVDTGHSDVGPFVEKSEAQEHLDRINRDRNWSVS